MYLAAFSYMVNYPDPQKEHTGTLNVIIGRNTYGIDSNDNGLCVQSRPRHLNLELMDVTRNEGERKAQLPF